MSIQELISSTGVIVGSMITAMETTGDRIQHIRKALGLTQIDFASRIDVTRGAVGNWEQNKGITQKNLQKIANTFGCSLDWLLSGKGAPFPESPTGTMPPSAGKKLDKTLYKMAHDMARRFEQTHLGGLADFEDFTFLVENYYNELLIRKTQFENSSEEEH